MTIQELTQKITENEISQKEITNKFQHAIKTLSEEKTELFRQRQLLLNDLNLDRILEAEKILDVKGLEYIGKGDTEKTIQNAIEIISQGGKGKYIVSWGKVDFDLFKWYFGCKNYAPWICQGENHPYGYGPKHGTIIFKIGLYPEIRKQNELTPEQIEICLYYLGNIKKIALQKKETKCQKSIQ